MSFILDMQRMHNQRMDLNLLQVFDAVYRERSVSRAATRLGLSQPAISHALRRLRLELKDPLFVRAPGGVMPTAMAEQLGRTVAGALHALDAAIHQIHHFEPRSSSRTFRLYMTDIGELVFLPALMEALQQRAPGVKIEVEQMALEAILPGLESGALDLAVGYLPPLADVSQHRLLHERYVIVLRRDHPLAAAGGGLDPAALDYVLVRPHAEARRALQQQRLESRVRLVIPHFLVLPGVLARTDLAALVPSRMARLFVERGELVALDSPLATAAFDVRLYWYWRAEHDPGHRWLRELLIALFSEGGPGDGQRPPAAGMR